MRYIEHQPGGGPEVLHPAQTERPTPRAGEVLIQVAAAGVNRPDVAQRNGSYPPPADASPILGLEVAGTIVAVGPDVDRWQPGDQVCALTPGGGYAEYCVTPAVHCLPIPAGLSLVEAASLPENYFTVWTNVFDRGRLQQGEHFLVHGGSGGIGQCAIQLARQFGAIVHTTVGTAEKVEFCRDLGAHHVYRYRDEDWADLAYRNSSKHGMDVILDMVGGDYAPRHLRLLALEGRLVNIAMLAGRHTDQIDIAAIMSKRLTWTGSTLRPRSVADKAAIAQALEQHVWPLFASGALKPTIHATFPLEEARAAHELMETSSHQGKIVLTLP